MSLSAQHAVETEQDVAALKGKSCIDDERKCTTRVGRIGVKRLIDGGGGVCGVCGVVRKE